VDRLYAYPQAAYSKAQAQLDQVEEIKTQAYIIGAVAIVWTLLVQVIWRAPGLSRYVGILSERLEKS